jgi:hypothetical protein
MDLSRTVKSVLRAGTTVTKHQWIVLAAKFVCQAKVSQTHRVPVAWTACPDNSAVNLNKLNAKIATEENTRPKRAKRFVYLAFAANTRILPKPPNATTAKLINLPML